MSTRTPLSAKVAVAVFVLATVVVGALLSRSFGGPGIGASASFEASAELRDAVGVPRGADVLVRGVKVGRVASVRRDGAAGRLRLELSDDRPVLHPDAAVTIGAKTPLGEAFVDLDPGRAPGAPLRSGARLGTRPAVEVDEALRVLDPAGRRDLAGTLRATGRGLRSPAAPQRLGATLDGLDRATGAVARLGEALRGQEDDLEGSVQGARVVLGALAQRDVALREAVRAARRTLAATAGRRRALRATVRELGPLARTTTATLRAARPLLREAVPLATRLGRAAPPLTAALSDLPAPLRDAGVLLERAPRLRRAAVPALGALGALAPRATGALERGGPALANLVPMLDYLAPRSDTIAAWFSNTDDLGSNGDAKGRWARFFVLFDPATVLGTPGGAPPGNAYTRPGDATANAPYRTGDFPRLLPYRPALGAGGRAGGPP